MPNFQVVEAKKETASTFDEQAANEFFLWIRHTFLAPEIRKRVQNGQLRIETPLKEVQIILNPDTGSTEVRINEEVKIKANF